MKKLNLYKERGYNVITVPTREGGSVDFKIPEEYTVNELERILEKQIALDQAKKEPTVENGADQLKEFWALVFSELEILFQHYLPEITEAELRSMLTHEDALRVVDWYNEGKKLEPSKKKVI